MTTRWTKTLLSASLFPVESDIRVVLTTAMKDAMKRRDREALSVFRTALAAIANAEAVTGGAEAGAIESSPVGVGGAEVARRELTEDDVAEIVRGEIAERRTAASSVRAANPEAATRLAREAALLATVLAGMDPR